MTKPEVAFIPGSSKELNAIHAVVMGVGDDWPDVEGDPYTLRHVKWMARELNASVSRDNKVEELRQSLLTAWRTGVDDVDRLCRYPALAFFGCKSFHELEKLTPATSLTQEKPMNEQAIEQAIQATKPTAPRLTPTDIDSVIVGETYTVLPSGKVMVCELTLRNGFTVRGEGATVSKANFNEEIGRRISRENARNKIWELEGYRLQQNLHDAHFD